MLPWQNSIKQKYFVFPMTGGTGQLKCDGTRAKTRLGLSAKRTSPFKLAGGVSSVNYWQPEVCAISGSNVGYTKFRGSVKSTGYPLHSPVSHITSLPVRHREPSHFNWTLHTATVRFYS